MEPVGPATTGMEAENPTHSVANQGQACPNCGGMRVFAPEASALLCTYCAAQEVISPHASVFQGELAYEHVLQQGFAQEHVQQVAVVDCQTCGARPTLRPHVTADQCPFCGANLVIVGGTQASLLKPQSLLPFSLSLHHATKQFQLWIAKRWFAPSDLKKKAHAQEKLRGIYIPYWTFDSQTSSEYEGKRGDDYTDTESYTDSEGQRRTRTVTRTAWTSVSGQVTHFFDDVLVVASRSLPKKYADELEPWDLQQQRPYDDRYLAGFQAETYQVALPDGFEEAKKHMDASMYRLVCEDIGGDHQRVDSVETTHSNVTFKHMLLPIWISVYTYRNKLYRFLVNGRTGEVQGERPYSVLKITLAFLLATMFTVGLVVAYLQFKK